MKRIVWYCHEHGDMYEDTRPDVMSLSVDAASLKPLREDIPQTVYPDDSVTCPVTGCRSRYEWRYESDGVDDAAPAGS